MLGFFRNFATSKFGVGIVLAFLVLLMLAFAGGDIANYGSFGGGGAGGDVAKVGSRDIPAKSLDQAARAALENIREKDPKASMRQLIAEGGLNDLLDRLVDRAALIAFGEDHGLTASERLLGSELAKVGAFKGPDGRFSEGAYQQALAQRGLSDAQVREDFTANLVARQILVPAAFGATFSGDMAMRYTTLLKERRIGSIALLPAAAFGAGNPPSDAQLREFYTRHRNNYLRPERRVIRFATFDGSAIKTVPAPSEAEIAARYKANSALYAASETRKVSQLILPTEAAAKAVLAEVGSGKSLEVAASGKGLAVATLDGMTREKLAGQSTSALAAATFTAARGTTIGPQRTPLGWHLMRVDAITGKPARALEQVRGELVTALTEEKRRKALSDFTAEIEDEFDNGGSLGDVAKELGVALTQTAPLTADGAVYGKPGEKAPVVLARVLSTAFAMEGEQQPQIAEIENGKTFLVFDVTSIAASAPAPLAEIRPDLVRDYAMEQGAGAAKAAAEKALAATKKGQDLSAALVGVGVAIPPLDQVSMSREELVARQQAVPPPLRLLFNMAAGTTKILPAPRNRGYYVVQLKTIVPGTVAASDPLLTTAKRELAVSSGREFAEQLRRAIRKEVGVSKNDAAVKALARTLTGGN